jgi:uncharacterized protein DUF3618
MADTDTAPAVQDPEALVGEIARTRDNLARTIDAIAERVNPANNARRAMERVREQVGKLDKQAREQAGQLDKQAHEQAGKLSKQVREQAGRIDKRYAAAAGAAVAVGVAALLIWRRRK